MNEEDEFTLWVGAWRYYCGRRTYAVGMFCEALRRAWTSIPQRARALIQRELDAEFVRDDELRVGGAKYKALGDDCDRAEWEKVRKLWKVGAGDTAEKSLRDMTDADFDAAHRLPNAALTGGEAVPVESRVMQED